nr:hypothetical protein [Tanacetum cinerariifolium]
MAPLTFADMYNMVAFLSKSDASTGFDQVVDFLNAHTIQYALVVNPTIYVSCIKQFWVMTTIKKCLSVKRTAWNEFSCSMASAVICVATGKGFSGFKTPLFASMLVQPQPQAAGEEEEVNISTAPAPPSPTTAPLTPPQDPTPTTYATPPASPLQEQPTTATDSSMSLLTTLMETCASLSQKVDELEQYKHTQALYILKLKKRVKKLENKRRSNHSRFRRLRKGRINQEEVNAASKGVNATEPTVFDDEEEVQIAAAGDKQEKADLKRAQVLQKQKYQNLKKKHVSITQARKNMIIYLKNMTGYKMEYFREMTYDKVKPMFKREYKKVQTLFKPDKDVKEPKKKRVAEEILLQESFKKLKAVKVSSSESTQETTFNDLKEMSEEDGQNMLKIIPVSEFKVKALQVKYPIIDWEIYTEVEEDNKMARDLVMKIFMKANKPKSRSLDTSSK